MEASGEQVETVVGETGLENASFSQEPLSAEDGTGTIVQRSAPDPRAQGGEPFPVEREAAEGEAGGGGQ